MREREEAGGGDRSQRVDAEYRDPAQGVHHMDRLNRLRAVLHWLAVRIRRSEPVRFYRRTRGHPRRGIAGLLGDGWDMLVWTPQWVRRIAASALLLAFAAGIAFGVAVAGLTLDVAGGFLVATPLVKRPTTISRLTEARPLERDLIRYRRLSFAEMDDPPPQGRVPEDRNLDAILRRDAASGLIGTALLVAGFVLQAVAAASQGHGLLHPLMS